MVIDEYMGVRTQRDFLELAGAYIDLAKIATGISMLLERTDRIYASLNLLPEGPFTLSAAIINPVLPASATA